MHEKTAAAATALPPVQSAVGDPVSTPDSTAEIPPDILGRLKTVTVSPNEIRRLAASDKCTQRLKQELATAKQQSVPARAEIEAAKKRLKLAHQELSRLQSARETRGATVRMLEAQLFQRLTTIAEREEARKVRAIRHRIAPEFRVPTSSGQ